jgi:hypothetical protein
MNYLKFAFFLLLALSYTACEDDDGNDPSCTQADWVGTYSGTIDCDGDVEDVSVTITASGENDIVIKYSTMAVDAEYDPFTPDNCELDVNESDGSFSLILEVDLDGDNLMLKEILSGGTVTSTCDISATRN